MRLCLSCWLRHISDWKLALLILAIAIVLFFSHYGLFTIGKLSEQARLSVKWERLADANVSKGQTDKLVDQNQALRAKLRAQRGKEKQGGE
jgi:F0F1-type ATP synthase membrane subunit b/b'